MRHKILFALHEETVQKGKALFDEAGRKARKHGGKAQKRGISNEYICICTGVERKCFAFASSVNRAMPSIEKLKEAFTGHIADKTLVLCDGLYGYSSLEELAKCIVKEVTSEPEDHF